MHILDIIVIYINFRLCNGNEPPSAAKQWLLLKGDNHSFLYFCKIQKTIFVYITG